MDRNKKGLFVQWMQKEMMHKETNNKTTNVIEVIKREYLFNNGEYVEYFWVRMLKEVLLMFAVKKGRGGCPNIHMFSPPF